MKTARFNWRTWVLSLSILICIGLANHGNNTPHVVASTQQTFFMPVIVQPQETIEEKFERHFPRSHKTMLAIAKAESGLNNEAKNWNCYYNDDETIVYEERVKGSHSTACKKEHRQYAWSVDCFILQANYMGKHCPDNVSIDQHLEEMAQLSKQRHFQPWIAWQRGMHLVHLD